MVVSKNDINFKKLQTLLIYFFMCNAHKNNSIISLFKIFQFLKCLMTTNYYLRGELISGQSVIIVATDDSSNVYFLSTDTATGGLVFDPQAPGTSTVSTLDTFVIQGNSMTMQIFTPDHSSAISTNNSNIAVLGSVAETFTQTTLGIANFGVVLTGAFYTLLQSGGNPVQFQTYIPIPSSTPGDAPTGVQMTGDVPTIAKTYLTAIRFIPTSWYTQNDCSSGPATPKDAAVAEYDWTYPKDPSLGGPPPNGFTNLPDCEANFFYNYCPNSTVCGGGASTVSNATGASCKGPCVSPLDVCAYDSTTQVFSCEVSPDTVATSLWEQLWFRILIIAIVVIIVALFFFVLFKFAFGSSSTTTAST